MIISDRYEFVYIHIPKCGGSTVRSRLQNFDETNGAFTGRVEVHPDLGLVDYVHIPLFVLKKYFPNEYQKVIKYKSFAVVRDPFARFPSSFAQHLKRYGMGHIKDLSPSDLKSELTRVICDLEKMNDAQTLLPAKYIHFQPQHDYVYHDGRKIIDAVYGLDDLESLFYNINEYLGEGESGYYERSEQRVSVNQSVVYRFPAMRKLITPASPIVKVMLKPFLSDQKYRSLRSIFYTQQGAALRDLVDSDYVKSFIEDFYQRDFELLASLDKCRSKESQ
ncbi:sulfotransferase family 2 domain-containing protein [Guyparkeria halopsychrophila]|uniref:sulfotransferase family 2 domain-containing protein n=1 Tax=Guyparkeria halopsychrophila TaxID=3139421 RepID=UPI0037C99610